MRKTHYMFTKPRIVSARISDDEMENVKQLMEVTSMSASELMRKAFQLQRERFNVAGMLSNSNL
ncbi:MAG: hypothetical protein A2X83_03240 [Desulfuromonadales bacterium GWD2_54_10]|nr:MAG: hypothetical protein A2X83_03240 [Desulfuromonadales bacterium GWD2_54_10]